MFFAERNSDIEVREDGTRLLGGWSAKGSDRYARIACVKIAHLQNAVISALQSTMLQDPIAESEISYDLMAHLENLKIDKAQQEEILNCLESSGPIRTREPAVLFAVPDQIVPDDERPLEDPIDVLQEDQLRTEKRRQKFDLRTERLGSNPRETRRLLREQLAFTFLTQVKSTFACCIALALVTISWDSTVRTTSLWEQRCWLSWSMTRYSSGTCTSSSTDAESPDGQPVDFLFCPEAQNIEVLNHFSHRRSARTVVNSLTDKPDLGDSSGVNGTQK